MFDEQPRIVVAEDARDVLSLIMTRLDLAGYRTFVARNGYEALEAVKTVRPHGLVLDLGMPILDGFGVLTTLRRNPKLHAPPTLVLTARNHPPDVNRAIDLGARDYLTKPFEVTHLLARVARLLRRRPPMAPALHRDADLNLDLD